MKTKMKNPQKTQKPQKSIKFSKVLNPKTQKPLLLPTLGLGEDMGDTHVLRTLSYPSEDLYVYIYIYIYKNI